MSGIVTLELAGWRPVLAPGVQELSERERRFLSPEWSDGRAKNISLEGARLKGARGSAEDLAEMTAMVARFAQNAADRVTTLFPRDAP